MESKELRIGNIIEYSGVTKEVLGIDEETVFLKNTISINYIDIDEVFPIPLTKEWLLKFGFEETDESEDVEWYNLNGFWIAIYEENEDVYFVYQHIVLRNVYHVHQLQNLYFAITGKELNHD